MIYTGIGSRRTPEKVLKTMTAIAQFLANHNFILRSGGAAGADTAFEIGCDLANGKKEIYLPWKGFNGNNSHLYNITEDAYNLAKKYHPAWNKLSQGARKLQARNCYQVLGESLNSPTDFIICYSEGTGGTEQALRIARDLNIEVINMFDDSWFQELKFTYIRFLARNEK